MAAHHKMSLKHNRRSMRLVCFIELPARMSISFILFFLYTDAQDRLDKEIVEDARRCEKPRLSELVTLLRNQKQPKKHLSVSPLCCFEVLT